MIMVTTMMMMKMIFFGEGKTCSVGGRWDDGSSCGGGGVAHRHHHLRHHHHRLHPSSSLPGLSSGSTLSSSLLRLFPNHCHHPCHHHCHSVINSCFGAHNIPKNALNESSLSSSLRIINTIKGYPWFSRQLCSQSVNVAKRIYWWQFHCCARQSGMMVMILELLRMGRAMVFKHCKCNTWQRRWHF